jgi:hypothetical protein
MKSHQGDPITTHITLGEKQFNGTLGLCQPIKGRRTRRIHNKNRGRRGALDPSHDPEIIGAHLHEGLTAGSAPQTLPWHRRAQGRDQIKTGPTARVSPNRSIGPPSARVGSYRTNPTRALLRGGPAAHLPRFCRLSQQAWRQRGANSLKHHFSQRLTVVNRIGGLLGIARIDIGWVRLAWVRLTKLGLTRIR